jgi:hypothetical protein
MATALQRRARKDRTGRTQRRRSHTARTRHPNLAKYYGKRLPSVTAGEFDFSLTLLRGKGNRSIPLDSMLVSFEWADEESMLSGNLQLRRPDAEDRSSLPIGSGHRVRCRVKWGAHWYELWTMRCSAPTTTVETGEVSVDLKDDLDLVRRGVRHYLFRKTKRRKHGYFGHDVLRIAARREGIRLGQIAKCRHRMDKIDIHGSFLQLAEKVYTEERTKTGRKFVLRMRDGRFEVVPYKRNAILYILAEQLRTASVVKTPKKENPVTVLKGRARIGKGKAAKKIRHTDYRRDLVARFGYMEKEKDFGRVKSHADLRAQMRRELAQEYKIDTTFSVQHQGIPFIRRGDGCQLVIPSEDITGTRSFVYATAGRHQVQRGTYTSEWDFNRDDLYEQDRERREKEARARKRKARKKRKRGDQH